MQVVAVRLVELRSDGNPEIAAGAHVQSLTSLALSTGEKIGRVEVDMGDTACEVPFAPDYIREVEKRGAIGKKRKSVKC